MGYSKCIACQKKWVNKSTAAARKDWAKLMLKSILTQRTGILYASQTKYTGLLARKALSTLSGSRENVIAPTVYNNEMSEMSARRI